MRNAIVCTLAAVTGLTCISTSRAQYNLVGVELDLPSGHPNRIGSNITPARVDPPSAIRFDVNGNGYRYPNRSGLDIKGVRLQVADPNKDRFDPGQCSGGRMFADMRVIDDGKTIEFGGGLLLDADEIWIYMPNRSQGMRLIYYLGEALTSDPIPVPVISTKDPVEDKRAKLWQDFRGVCPSKYRQFDAYGESPSFRYLCFVSQGITFLYDHEKETLSEVFHDGRLEDGMPNHISYQSDDKGNEVFTLWRSGKRIVDLDLKTLKVGVEYSRASRSPK